MNKVYLMGRLTKDPIGAKDSYAKFTLAVDRRVKKENEQSADFISCVAFGKLGDFVLNYLTTGTKVALSGRIQTGSYMKDGNKVYTTEVVAEEIEFCEKKSNAGSNEAPPEEAPPAPDEFITVDANANDLPFKN